MLKIGPQTHLGLSDGQKEYNHQVVQHVVFHRPGVAGTVLQTPSKLND